ncbi:MAG: dihydrolipoamide acetyltransferase [Buchnera aphidicola (Periphyllus aceris)]|nr:dihydrolipoamide acetyltransferase [Buchnera aphidicola (Periphyllus aceris)]
MSLIIKVPDIGIDEAEVIEILVKPMDQINLDQGLIIVEGQKASIEIPSPYEGIVKDIYVKVGDVIHINSSIMSINSIKLNEKNNIDTKFSKNSDSEDNKIFVTSESTNNTFNKENSVLVYASPSIKRLCRKLKISINKIKGTGRKNRILKEDVLDYIKLSNKKSDLCIKNNINFIEKLKDTKLERDKTSKNIIFLSKIQRISSKIFSRNWNEIPHVTQFKKIDITKLENFRNKINNECKSLNVKFTLLTFIIKAISISLKKFKKFNSSLHDKKDRIIIKNEINVGIAVNTKDGVVVPVLKNVDKKSLKNISEELVNLSIKSRDNKLKLNEMSQGSFTISNLGNFDVGEFTPIINSPEVAILGVSRANLEPVWNNDCFIPRLLLPISLSYDHRVINGVDGAIFIKNLNKNLIKFHRLLF